MLFTPGNSPITDVITNSTIDVGGIYVSETELTCETPNFAMFGARNAVVQVKISDGDLTTTFAPFSY